MMPSAAVPIPLSELRVGSRARFHEARLDPASCRLLRALGLTTACEVRLCKTGEPCIVQVRTTRIGLSMAVAGGIFVIPDAGEAA